MLDGAHKQQPLVTLFNVRETNATWTMVYLMTGATSALAMTEVFAVEALTMESSGTALKVEGEHGDLLKWLVLST